MRRPSPRLKRRSALWTGWALILVVGVLLRVWQLRDQLLLDDEWHALHKIVTSGFAGILTSFGQADHSIPITAYYELLSRIGEVTELAMRLPMLLAGVATLVAVPALLRPHARPNERLILAGLLALSPLLIHFSRYARPYALSTLFAFAAIMLFRQWWLQRRCGYAFSYLAAATSAAWLQPVTLAFSLSPFLYVGACASWRAARWRDAKPLIALLALGSATAALLALLLGPPLYNDSGSLSSKAAVDSLTPSSLWQTLQLLLGATGPWAGIIGALLAAFGLIELYRRDAAIAGYLVFVVCVPAVAIALSGAAWIQHALVFARYLLPLLPILLLFISLGAARLLVPLNPGLRVGTIMAGLTLIYTVGPLPNQYHDGLNQFTNHMAYQFDYDWTRNPYTRGASGKPIPGFYRALGQRPGDTITLVEAPWYFEAHWNLLYRYQRVHGQRVMAGLRSGFCVEHAPGEYPLGQPGIALEQAVHISELLNRPERRDIDYLVWHRKPPANNARPLRNRAACERRLREAFGTPEHESEQLVVFKLGSSTQPVPPQSAQQQ